MSVKKLLSVWIFIVSVIIALIGFVAIARKMDLGYWAMMIGLGIISGSYYLSGIQYYLEQKDMKFLYLIFVASLILSVAALLGLLPTEIDFRQWEVNAKIADDFFFALAMLILGVLSGYVAFAPFNNFMKKFQQDGAYFILHVCILLTLLPLFLIIYHIVSKGAGGITWGFLTGDISNLGEDGGVFPAIIGSLGLLLVTAVIVLPLGVGTSIYLSEYAKKGLGVRVIRTGVNILQGTPSIVHGLFGFAVFVSMFGMCLLSAGLTLAILTLPIVIRSSEEAFNAVPKELREASFAVGATKWQTIRKVVLPPALPGIITGTVLGMGRAAGETAPILFTGVIFSGAGVPDSIFSRFQALPFHLLRLYRLIGYKEVTQNAWATALLLLILVLSINVVAIILREKYRQRF
ncbi:MAG: phosphate ABC transporter permease PstA [Thermoplasmata archaeon]